MGTDLSKLQYRTSFMKNNYKFDFNLYWIILNVFAIHFAQSLAMKNALLKMMLMPV